MTISTLAYALVIIYISSHMHLSYKGILICAPVSLTLSLSTDVEQALPKAFFAQHHYSCCKASYLHSAKETTKGQKNTVIHKCSHAHTHTLENKGKEIKSTGAFREHGKLKRSAVKSRTSIIRLLYSLFGGVRVPWCRHGVGEWVVIGDVHWSWWPG